MQVSSRIRAAFACRDHINKLTSTPRSHVQALNLLRVLSTVWILAVHSYSFALVWLDFERETLGKPERAMLYQFVANGTFVVDNFFLLGGFLAHRRRRIRARTFSQLLGLIWARYIRLAAALMPMILLAILVLDNTHCTSPNWPKSTLMFNQWCSSSAGWLPNLFMGHNFVRTETMCFAHSWYLAADFQLFAALQLADWLLERARIKRASLWCALLAIALAQSLSALQVYRRDLPPMPLLPARNPESMDEYYRVLYIKPHYWTTSYLIGALWARNCQRIERRRIERARLFACLNLIACFTLIMSNYPFFRTENPMSRAYASAYALLARPLWSLNVACLVVMCRQLKCKAALPTRPLACLGRLSFAAYLFHPVLMAAFYGSRRERFHFSHFLLLYFTLGHLCLTYLGAAIIHVLIELPCRILLTKGAGDKATNVVNTRELRTIASGGRAAPDGRRQSNTNSETG